MSAVKDLGRTNLIVMPFSSFVLRSMHRSMQHCLENITGGLLSPCRSQRTLGGWACAFARHCRAHACSPSYALKCWCPKKAVVSLKLGTWGPSVKQLSPWPFIPTPSLPTYERGSPLPNYVDREEPHVAHRHRCWAGQSLPSFKHWNICECPACRQP